MLKKKKAISPATNFSLKGIKSFHLDATLVDEFEGYTGLCLKDFNSLVIGSLVIGAEMMAKGISGV